MLPEVVTLTGLWISVETCNTISRHPYFLGPDIKCLIILTVDMVYSYATAYGIKTFCKMQGHFKKIGIRRLTESPLYLDQTKLEND